MPWLSDTRGPQDLVQHRSDFFCEGGGPAALPRRAWADGGYACDGRMAAKIALRGHYRWDPSCAPHAGQFDFGATPGTGEDRGS